MNNDQPIIHGTDIAKMFKDFWGRTKVTALSGVDISVAQGSIFGLLGPNGAGKSTLIKLILGHLYPTSGSLHVLGKSPRDVGIKRRIGYLPESMCLYKHLTAAETLNYFGAILSLSPDQIESRSRQLLDMVGLGAASKRLVGEFSHGMGRRLGLAQALLNDPDLLILDEPTAGLDPVGCREVKDLIITLGKRGKTILLTSHLLSDVEDVCDEILLLFAGRVQTRGTVQDLLTDSARTRLEFPSVSPDTLDKAKHALSTEIGPDTIDTSAPAENLESFFLKAVAQGNIESPESQGARLGSGVASYLRDESYTTSSLIEELKQDDSIDTSALDALNRGDAPKTADDTGPDIDQDTLEELTEDIQDTDTSEADEGVDKDTLDDLMK